MTTTIMAAWAQGLMPVFLQEGSGNLNDGQGYKDRLEVRFNFEIL